MRFSLAACLVALTLLGACGGSYRTAPTEPADSGSRDPGGSIGPSTDAGPGLADAGVADRDAGGPDAGSPDAGDARDAGAVSADAGGPDGGAVDPVDGGTLACGAAHPAPACAATRPDTSHAVCRIQDVHPPIAWLDGGIPGPCDELTYDRLDFYSGPPAWRFGHHVTWVFDASGHLLGETQLAEDGGVTSKSTNDYDSCGRLVYSETVAASEPTRVMELDYGPEGLLTRRVQQAGSYCAAQGFVYVAGDGGVVSQFDQATCAKLADYSFGADGRLQAVQGVGPSAGGQAYQYFPDGGVQAIAADNRSFGSGLTKYDDTGAVVLSEFHGSYPSYTLSQSWKYSASHGLLENHSFFHDHGPCGTSTHDSIRTWDAGVLAERTDTDGYGCPFTTTQTRFAYSHPDAGVEVEQELLGDGGTLRLQRTISDALGNPLAVDEMVPPDPVWHPRLRRSYDCFSR